MADLPAHGGRVLWGTSFDATAVSGVVSEFIKLARVFWDWGYRVHLDLGYDIKADKGHLFQSYKHEADLLPSWICLDRIDSLESLEGYDEEFVRQVLHDVVQEHAPQRSLPRVRAISAALAEQITRKWQSLNVSLVIVENGTLPENIVYTRALYAAIEEYGRANTLGTYVLWRDHDLMWSSEPGTGKYGGPPYRGTVKPVDSPFIRYVTLHRDARRKLLDWAPGLSAVTVLPNTFTPVQDIASQRNPRFRSHFGIPAEAFLISRYTRVIRQKRIDRDIRLLAAVSTEFAARGIGAPVFLFIAGDTAESPTEFCSLARLAESLSVRRRVIFGGPLAPLEAPGCAGRVFSVKDLLADTDLACFLTSYDYESYGNPIGEAIASGVPYISTRYQAYDTVYGRKGFRGPVMEITSADDEQPDQALISEVTDLLTDDRRRREIARFNQDLGRSCFAPTQVARLAREFIHPPVTASVEVSEPWPTAPMRSETRMSVIVPVYNEAGNIETVLGSLHDQWDTGRPLDPRTYEVVLVDNNSSDGSMGIAREFAADHPDLTLLVVREPEQGVACARKAGMEFAARRSHRRDEKYGCARPFYLVSADADCLVDRRWLAELLHGMESTAAAIGVCDYYYPAAAFIRRPRLWDAIQRTLRCRHAAWRVFGGFPDGKGFAVDRDKYERVGGIEIAYQLKNGRFRNHLSDDWDFGIKMRAFSEEIVYVAGARVEINPRRVDHAIDEVITGKAYGSHGIITMRDIRAVTREADRQRDLTPAEAQQAWEFSIKDFTPKNLILPLLLSPLIATRGQVTEFLTPSLARALTRRAAEIMTEMSLTSFLPIHSYKTPSYRLYFEFADELFARLRAVVGDDIGYPPPLPDCFSDVPRKRFAEFVRYYCEDRESGEAHDYFGNGGVF
jgi:GT2 family glycosyltransferase